VKLLAAGDFEAAAIDAPFSLPLAHMPRGGHAELLQQIRALPNGPESSVSTRRKHRSIG
jgi:hypothetical protein